MGQLRLPFSPYGVVDLVTHRLTEMALYEDHIGQLIFAEFDKPGGADNEENVYMMRRFLHTYRVLETELRMRYKARGYHGT